jgi:Domain of unknown function (DUF1906)
MSNGTTASATPMRGIDAPVNLTNKANCLRQNGFAFAIRYYNLRNSNVFPEKCLKLPEARALVQAGFQLGVVFQQSNNSAGSFNREIGRRHGKKAHERAADIGQPAGSGIYFAVDFDATPAQVNGVITEYFKGVNEALSQANGGSPRYEVGVYGSGLTCSKLLEKGLISLTWLTMSTGFNGSQQFAQQKRYNLIQFLDKTICGVDLDPNENNPAKPTGFFTIPVS